jgi:hypothetical protein
MTATLDISKIIKKAEVGLGPRSTEVGLDLLVYLDQPVFSGDDMNTIQVGRPAVSRYHRQRRYFAEGEGYNFRTHDFPHAWAGVKLGGFMLLNGYSYGIPDDSDVSIEEDDMDDMGDDDSEDDRIIHI